jgi:hypothetical protein
MGQDHQAIAAAPITPNTIDNAVTERRARRLVGVGTGTGRPEDRLRVRRFGKATREVGRGA